MCEHMPEESQGSQVPGVEGRIGIILCEWFSVQIMQGHCQDRLCLKSECDGKVSAFTPKLFTTVIHKFYFSVKSHLRDALFKHEFKARLIPMTSASSLSQEGEFYWILLHSYPYCQNLQEYEGLMKDNGIKTMQMKSKLDPENLDLFLILKISRWAFRRSSLIARAE